MTDLTRLSSTDIISAAIAEHVRALGGDADALHQISCAASYAVVCWSLAAAQRGGSIQCDPGSSSDPGFIEGNGRTCMV